MALYLPDPSAVTAWLANANTGKSLEIVAVALSATVAKGAALPITRRLSAPVAPEITETVSACSAAWTASGNTAVTKAKVRQKRKKSRCRKCLIKASRRGSTPSIFYCTRSIPRGICKNPSKLNENIWSGGDVVFKDAGLVRAYLREIGDLMHADRPALSRSQKLVRRVAAFVLAAFVAGVSGMSARASDTITLQVGQSKTISTPGLSRVAIGDSTIAGVVPIGTSQVLVNGKGNGRTTLLVWEDGEEVVYTVDVHDAALDDIASMVKAAVSDPGVKFATFPHALIVKGSVQSRSAYHEISSILSRFESLAKADHYTIVNAVTIATSTDAISRELSGNGAHNVSVEVDGNGNLVVSGEVDTRLEAEQVLARAQALAGAEFSGTGKLVDRLSVKENTQIDIKVYVLEVDNSALGNFGVSLQSATVSPNQPGGFLYSQPFFPITEGGSTGTGGHAFNAGPWVRTTLLAPTLNLLMQSGHARILSSPDLVATSGSAASFLVGGEIPYLYSTGLGQVSVVFKQYGVNLKVTPTLLPNGAVSAAINPDISELDFQNAVSFGGYSVPALDESTISTNVIANDGQSIVMGGLLRRLSQQTIQKIPVLSSLPILGKLFQSKSYQTGESNVVFIMTPRVITTP